MPIEVQHGSNGELEALVALLSALPQQGQQPVAEAPVMPRMQSPIARAQQRPRDALDDIIDQLAPLAAPGANGSTAPRDPYAAGGESYPRYQLNGERPSYAAAARSAPRLYNGSANGSVNGYDRMADQDARAYFNAQQQQQLQEERQRQQYDTIAMNQGDQMARWAQDLPPAVQMGLNDGSYAHTPQQQRDMQADLDAIAKVDSDPSWNPQQKEAFKAQRWMHYKQIHSNPQPVPASKRPVTPQQQFEQSVVTYTDPNTGKKIQGFLGSRNGEPHFMPFKPPVDPHEIEAIRQENRVAIEKIKAENKAAAEAAKPPKETPQQIAAKRIRIASISAQITNHERMITDAEKDAKTAKQNRLTLQSDISKKGSKTTLDDVNSAWDEENLANQRLQDLKKRRDEFVKQAQEAEAAAEESAGMVPVPVAPSAEPGGYNDMMQSEADRAAAATNDMGMMGAPPTEAPPTAGPPVDPVAAINQDWGNIDPGIVMPGGDPNIDPGIEMRPPAPVQPPSAGAITVWSSADLQRALSDPNVPPGTTIIWGPTGKSRAK